MSSTTQRRTMKAIRLMITLIMCCLWLKVSMAQVNHPKIGAYYFDGWTGAYSYHITPKLVRSFKNREPKWGWKTSTQQLVDAQIEAAANSGLAFFCFCWYFNDEKSYKKYPLNNALSLYLTSKKKARIDYCLLVVNEQGSKVNPANWELLTDEWITHFKNGSYLTAQGKPLLIFYRNLTHEFNSADSVKSALDLLRAKALHAGLPGVTVALCTNPDDNSIALANACGFDVLTGYNYHAAGFGSGKKNEIPIDSLASAEYRAWTKFPQKTELKYMPAVTLNWDPRPWSNKTNQYDSKPYYVGYSPASVEKSVKNCLDWMSKNNTAVVKEQIAILYAWNENGEGAYLTPSRNGVDMLSGLKKALKSNSIR